MDARPHPARAPISAAGRTRDVAPFALTLACVCAFSFLSGGYIFTRSTPIAIAYLLSAAVWAWFLRRRSRPSLLYLTALAVFGAFVVWTGLSVLWSFGPDLSWMAFDVAALYAAAAAVIGLTPAGALQLRVVGVGFFLVALAVGVYALLGKVTPDLVTHAHTYARLDSPIGYWNVLALVMVLGLVVGLALAGDRGIHAVWRILAATACVPLCLTYFFTLSRGGWIALAVALIVYFALSTTRLSSFASVVVILAPAGAAVWKVRDLTTLFTATTDDALRTAQGHALLRWTLLALVVTAALQLVVVLAQRSVPWPRWLRIAAGVAIPVVLVLGISAGSWRYAEARGGTAWVKDRVHTFVAGDDQTSAEEGATRLVSLNTGRPPLWKEALEQSRSARMLGTGAGTFVLTHERFREGGGVVRHAHSQWLNVLSELGVVGLGLFVAAVVLFLAAAIRNPLRDRGDPLRPLVVAMQAGLVAFVVHISWDWDWDMAAVGVVFFLFAATCSSYLSTRSEAMAVAGRPPAIAADGGAETAAQSGNLSVEGADAWGSDPSGAGAPVTAAPAARRRLGSLPWRVAATLTLVLLAVSWLYPYLASRSESAALTAAGKGDLVTALSGAKRAVSLDPLSADNLVTESLVLEQLGRNGDALATLRRAQRLQPDDYKPYYQEGVLLLKAFGDRRGAIAALRHALALNPFDALSRYELEIATRRR